MMKVLLPAAALIAIATGCVTDTVERAEAGRARYVAVSVFDDSVRFPTQGSFDWFVEEPRAVGPSAPRIGELDGIIREALEQGFARRGFERRASGELSFYVTYYVAGGSDTTDDLLNTMYREPESGDRWLPGRDRSRSYEAGTLVVDLVCAQDACPRWRGAVAAGLREDLEPEEARTRVREAVRVLLLRFPPPGPTASSG
jgi:hypothetical protein